MKRPAVRRRPKPKSDTASLIGRLTPSLASPTRGGGRGWGLPVASPQSAARVAAWLASLKAKAPGKALKTLTGAHPPLLRLIGGIAEAAPYLWQLIQADAARFARLLESDPDGALASLLGETKNA